MRKLLHILQWKLRSFLKPDQKLGPLDFLKTIGSGSFYLIFAVGVFFFTLSIIDFLVADVRIGMFLLHEFLSMILFIFFLAVNVGNILVSWSTLYRSQEVPFLLARPIPPEDVFVIKFLDNFFYSSGTLLMVLFAVLAGYTWSFQLNLLDALTILLFNVMPFLFNAASLGVIVLLIIIKTASRIGLRTVMIIIGALYLGAMITFFELLSPAQLVNDVMQHYPNIDKYYGSLIPEALQYLPNKWLAEALYWTSAGQRGYAMLPTGIQFATAIVLFSGALLLGKSWYYKTWLAVPGMRSQKKLFRFNLLKGLAFHAKSRLHPATEAVIKKEFFQFVREPSQIIHFSVIFFLIILFLLSVSSLSAVAGVQVEMRTIIYLVVFLFNVLLVATLTLRFVFPMVSIEGLAFWKLKSAPLALGKYIRLKLLPFTVIILLLASAISIASHLWYRWELAVFSLAAMFFIAVGMILLNFGMGSLFAVYREKNPIRIASSQGATLTFLMSIVHMVLIILVMVYPVHSYMEAYYRFGQIKIGGFWIAVPLLAVLSVGAGAAFYAAGVKALRKDF